MRCYYECVAADNCVAFAYGKYSQNTKKNCYLYQGGPYTHGNDRDDTTCHIMIKAGIFLAFYICKKTVEVYIYIYYTFNTIILLLYICSKWYVTTTTQRKTAANILQVEHLTEPFYDQLKSLVALRMVVITINFRLFNYFDF